MTIEAETGDVFAALCFPLMQALFPQGRHMSHLSQYSSPLLHCLHWGVYQSTGWNEPALEIRVFLK